MLNQLTQTSIILSDHRTTNRLNSTTKSESNRFISSELERGQETRFRFQVLLNYDYSLLTFSIFNIALALIFYEGDYNKKVKVAQYCLFAIEAITIIQIVVTIFRYKAKVMLQKSQKLLQKQQGIISSGKIYQISMEIFVLFIKPYIFFQNVNIRTLDIFDGFEFQYKLNYIFVVLGFFKLFIALRVLLLRQAYMSPRCNPLFIKANRLCRMYGSDSNYLYSIKCLFKDSPLSLIGIAFTGSIIIFSICLRIAERQMDHQNRNLSGQYPKFFDGKPYPGNIQQFQNTIWLTIITMTTVGYGDLFPRTLFGRAINIVIIIWGSFNVSLMVVVLTNTLNMQQAQKRALIVLNRLEAKKQLKQSAAFLITHSCKKYLAKRRIERNQHPALCQKQRYEMQTKFYKYSQNFQDIHRKIRQMYEIDDVYEQMTRQFQVINDQVNQMIANQQKNFISFHPQATESPIPQRWNKY